MSESFKQTTTVTALAGVVLYGFLQLSQASLLFLRKSGAAGTWLATAETGVVLHRSMINALHTATRTTRLTGPAGCRSTLFSYWTLKPFTPTLALISNGQRTIFHFSRSKIMISQLHTSSGGKCIGDVRLLWQCKGRFWHTVVQSALAPKQSTEQNVADLKPLDNWHRKHIKWHPEVGHVVTEFLPDVSWAGPFNTISATAGHHIYEGRWLRDSAVMDDYTRFWLSRWARPREYTSWLANAVMAR